MRIIIDWLVLPIRSLVPAVILLVSLFSACSQSTSLTARPLTVAASVAFTEGPTVAEDGTVYFTDLDNSRIMRLSTDGSLSTFRQPSYRANGCYLIANGGCLRAKGEMAVRYCLELPEPI